MPGDEWSEFRRATSDLPPGWRPTPIRQFILKLHGHCNLACDYCYLYTKSDQTWRERPARMSAETVRITTARIAEHVREHQLPGVEVVFHGGEPLLAGGAFLGATAEQLRAALPAGTELVLTVQTNGVLLTPKLLDLLGQAGIRVGVSVDGVADDHDRRRRYASGRGSYDHVARGLRLLASEQYRSLFGGLLCTMSLDQNPVATYEGLLEFQPPAIDFLLPHGNWSEPPPGRPADQSLAPYAAWLGTVFDRWYGAPVRETRIRFFEEIIHLLLGGASQIETVGLSPASLLVVETDGAWEQVDTLKSNYHGAAATGLDVATAPVDRVLRHPGVIARQIGVAALADECRACPVVEVCGGGYYPHRYRAGAGYRNPSVYCADLTALIKQVRAALAATLAPHGAPD